MMLLSARLDFYQENYMKLVKISNIAMIKISCALVRWDTPTLLLWAWPWLNKVELFGAWTVMVLL
jgi:hypothetical protein